MKNLLIITILFVLLIVSWCAKQGLSQSELFDKKQECATLKKNIAKEYEGGKYYVGSVFYSEKRNSCLYRLSTLYIETIHPNHIIYDYFGGKEIINKNDLCRGEDVADCENQQKKFNKILEELKWE